MGAHADGRMDARANGARWMLERAPATASNWRSAAGRQAGSLHDGRMAERLAATSEE